MPARLIVAFLALALAGALLAGCGDDEDGDGLRPVFDQAGVNPPG